MPFTPFHFGPGMFLKAAAPAHFSFIIFCYAQVAIDLESGYYLYRGEWPVHRFCHTFIGATLVGVFCAVTGRALWQMVVHIWRAQLLTSLGRRFYNLAGTSWRGAFISALLGTYSHVILDGIMHRDLEPFQPFSIINPFLGLVSIGILHIVCIVSGILGMIVWLVRLDEPSSDDTSP